MTTEPSKRWWWLGWSWRIACATYLVGFLTFLPYQIMIIWWSALLFTPLIAVTLYMTRAPRLAKAGIPVMIAALTAAGYLIYAGISRQGIPQSPIYNVVWLVGALGPFVLFFVVSRYLASVTKVN